MITLAYLTESVNLHPDLYWSDENNWFPVEQTIERSITGAMIISTASRIGGRPITLEPEDDSSAWMPNSTLLQMRTWAAVPGRVLQLTLRGVTRDVIFRHQDGSPIEALPVFHYDDVTASDWYRITLKLTEL